jgi:hypothetical protein
MFHFHRCSGGSCPVQVTWRSLWHHLPPAKKTTTRCCEWISHQSIPKLLVNWVYHCLSSRFMNKHPITKTSLNYGTAKDWGWLKYQTSQPRVYQRW